MWHLRCVPCVAWRAAVGRGGVCLRVRRRGGTGGAGPGRAASACFVFAVSGTRAPRSLGSGRRRSRPGAAARARARTSGVHRTIPLWSGLGQVSKACAYVSD